jgi:hypothetical protein
LVLAPIADDEGNSLSYFAGQYAWAAVRVVALAILSERLAQKERDAKILESEAAEHDEAGDDEWHIKIARYLRRIVKAIRNQP